MTDDHYRRRAIPRQPGTCLLAARIIVPVVAIVALSFFTGSRA